MGIWGTVGSIGAGVGATLITGGNVGAGIAAAGAVGELTGGSGGGCTPPVQEARTLLSRISSADRSAWLAFVLPIDTGTGKLGAQTWSQAIRTNNAEVLAFEVAGGEDCRCTSEGCRQLQAKFWELANAYNALNTTAPAVPVDTTGGGGGGGGIVSGVRDYFTGIVTGATAGAQTAAQTGGAASRQAGVGAGVGGFLGGNLGIVLILALFLILGFVILRRG